MRKNLAFRQRSALFAGEFLCIFIIPHFLTFRKRIYAFFENNHAASKKGVPRVMRDTPWVVDLLSGRCGRATKVKADLPFLQHQYRIKGFSVFALEARDLRSPALGQQLGGMGKGNRAAADHIVESKFAALGIARAAVAEFGPPHLFSAEWAVAHPVTNHPVVGIQLRRLRSAAEDR